MEEDNEEDDLIAKITRKQKQIAQQEEIIAAIEIDNANCTDEINNLMNEKRVIEKEKQHERKRLENNAAAATDDMSMDSDDDIGSVDDSVEGIGNMPKMEERKTFGATDRPDLKKKHDDQNEERVEKQLRLEKTMKEAILEKLGQLLEEKINTLKKEKGAEKPMEEGDPGRPFVGSVLIKYIKSINAENSKELEAIEEEGQRRKIYTQSFRISKKTTFSDLKSAACEFWDEPDENSFQLFNKDYMEIPTKGEFVDMYYSVEKYFDQQQEKNAILYLQKSNENNQGEENDYGQEIKEVNNREGEKEGENPEEVFLNQFPGVRALYTKNRDQKKKRGAIDDMMWLGSRS